MKKKEQLLPPENLLKLFLVVFQIFNNQQESFMLQKRLLNPCIHRLMQAALISCTASSTKSAPFSTSITSTIQPLLGVKNHKFCSPIMQLSYFLIQLPPVLIPLIQPPSLQNPASFHISSQIISHTNILSNLFWCLAVFWHHNWTTQTFSYSKPLEPTTFTKIHSRPKKPQVAFERSLLAYFLTTTCHVIWPLQVVQRPYPKQLWLPLIVMTTTMYTYSGDEELIGPTMIQSQLIKTFLKQKQC